MQSVFLNGGMIGTTLDFDSTEQYITSTSQQRVRPTFVGNQYFGRSGSTSSTTVAFALSAGTGETVPQAGDLVLLTIAHGAESTSLMSAPSGYTQLARFAASDSNDTVLYVGYKIMGPTPDTTFPVVSSLNSRNAQTAIVFVFRGVDPANPIDVTTTTATGTNGRRANPPAITPITQNATVVAIGAGAHTASSVNYTTTTLTNFKTLFSTDTYDIVHGAGYFEWTSGAVDPAAFEAANSSTSDSWCAATVALRPALADVPVYGNFKNSGIWLLQSAYEAKYTILASKTFTLTATSGAASANNITTHSNLDAGPANISRILLVNVILSGATSTSISGVTIGGITATRRAGRTAADFVQSDIWSAVVPTGTTATVVVTASSGANSSSVALYSAIGYENVEWAGATDFQASNTSTALMDVTINVPQGGVILAGYNAANIQSSATRVWTGADVDINSASADGTTSAVSGDVNLWTTAKRTNAEGGNTLVSFDTSDTTRRRPAFAAVAFK
jgi:hypothetical protein